MIIAILVLSAVAILSAQASNRQIGAYLKTSGPEALKSALACGVLAITCSTAVVVLAIILLATGRG